MWTCLNHRWELFCFGHSVLGLRRGGRERNGINYLAGFDVQPYCSSYNTGPSRILSGDPPGYLSNSFAYRTGTARFDPPKPFNIAKFTPITFPSRLNNGPPDPPDVVAAS